MIHVFDGSRYIAGFRDMDTYLAFSEARAEVMGKAFQRDAIKKERCISAIQVARGHIRDAARILGVDRSTIQRWINKYGLCDVAFDARRRRLKAENKRKHPIGLAMEMRRV